MHDVLLDAGEHVAEPLDIEQPARRVTAGGLDQDVVGLVLVEHIVDDV